MGYTKVRDYAGGKADWTDAGLPLEGASGQKTAPKDKAHEPVSP
jgi:hypothetical protein